VGLDVATAQDTPHGALAGVGQPGKACRLSVLAHKLGQPEMAHNSAAKLAHVLWREQVHRQQLLLRPGVAGAGQGDKQHLRHGGLGQALLRGVDH
jgi:hypothetical protein